MINNKPIGNLKWQRSGFSMKRMGVRPLIIFPYDIGTIQIALNSCVQIFNLFSKIKLK